MANAQENLLTFRTLYDSPLIGVRDYHCRIGLSGPASEEQPDSDQIVLMRRGAFQKHIGRRNVTADVNQAVFFTQRSTYRISHPVSCGDRGTVFVPAPQILKDILHTSDPAADERTEGLFPFVTGPCAPDLFWRHREFVQHLESAEPLDPLWAEVTALQLIGDVLAAAYVQHDLPPQSTRSGTAADHTERVEAVKTHLASHLSERISLDDLARTVRMSPFHLSRIFKHYSGVPVHQYLTRLRLRAALEPLAEGTSDLTTLALEFGFASHSHFTDAFRREFGCPPSATRRRMNVAGLRKMSKILEVE